MLYFEIHYLITSLKSWRFRVRTWTYSTTYIGKGIGRVLKKVMYSPKEHWVDLLMLPVVLFCLSWLILVHKVMPILKLSNDRLLPLGIQTSHSIANRLLDSRVVECWIRRSLAVVAGMKKPNDHAEPTKVER